MRKSKCEKCVHKNNVGQNHTYNYIQFFRLKSSQTVHLASTHGTELYTQYTMCTLYYTVHLASTHGTELYTQYTMSVYTGLYVLNTWPVHTALNCTHSTQCQCTLDYTVHLIRVHCSGIYTSLVKYIVLLV